MKKVLQRPRLAEIAEQMRSNGQNLVLTNGTFDLLHVGHIRYLQRARALGDALAVGVNSDASARALKGPGRPVNTAVERAELLAALECVNFVTVFDEPTAVELVQDVHPDVYVKGGDYSSDPAGANYPPEAAMVSDYGGRVVILPFVAGRSTSALLERVRAGAGAETDTTIS